MTRQLADFPDKVGFPKGLEDVERRKRENRLEEMRAGAILQQ